jgi:hypothetical protein
MTGKKRRGHRDVKEEDDDETDSGEKGKIYKKD